MRYLALHEVSLQPPRDEVSPRLEEAILFVGGERSRQLRQREQDPDKGLFDSDDADAEQLGELSDAQLLQMATAHRRKPTR